MSGVRFEPSRQGFNDFRNEEFIQAECLKVAQDVAAVAGGKCARAFSCDVRPGRTRCHARASCQVKSAATKSEWYKGAFKDVKAAAIDAAKAMGGKESRWKSKKD